MARKETFTTLNTGAPEDVAEFERALFQAFAKSLSDPILKYIWDVDVSARRIRTKVPYSDQLIHVARLDGEIAAAGPRISTSRGRGSSTCSASPSTRGGPTSVKRW